MARDVRVEITDRAIITALNTPGGAVRNWSEATRRQIRTRARNTTPVNNALNALAPGHLPPGTMKAGWRADNIGTNGHNVRLTVYNLAKHSYWIEYGRGPTDDYEKFSWAKGRWPGVVLASNAGTRGYPPQHILRNAVNAVMPSRTNGRYTPLT